eukprot:1159010-Pelagomonas_calceolata.AAC.5
MSIGGQSNAVVVAGRGGVETLGQSNEGVWGSRRCNNTRACGAQGAAKAQGRVVHRRCIHTRVFCAQGAANTQERFVHKALQTHKSVWCTRRCKHTRAYAVHKVLQTHTSICSAQGAASGQQQKIAEDDWSRGDVQQAMTVSVGRALGERYVRMHKCVCFAATQTQHEQGGKLGGRYLRTCGRVSCCNVA